MGLVSLQGAESVAEGRCDDGFFAFFIALPAAPKLCPKAPCEPAGSVDEPMRRGLSSIIDRRSALAT